MYKSYLYDPYVEENFALLKKFFQIQSNIDEALYKFRNSELAVGGFEGMDEEAKFVNNDDKNSFTKQLSESEVLRLERMGQWILSNPSKVYIPLYDDETGTYFRYEIHCLYDTVDDLMDNPLYEYPAIYTGIRSIPDGHEIIGGIADEFPFEDDCFAACSLFLKCATYAEYLEYLSALTDTIQAKMNESPEIMRDWSKKLQKELQKDTQLAEKPDSLANGILFMLKNNDDVFKADDTIGAITVERNDWFEYVNIPLDTSLDITALFVEHILPTDIKNKILQEYECDSISEAIECGASFNVSLICGKAVTYIEVENLDSGDKYRDRPYAQEWYRNFAEEELAGMGLDSVNDMLKSAECKNKESIERDF